MEVIKTVNLTKYYGKARGIKNLNLTVNEGECFGFIGPVSQFRKFQVALSKVCFCQRKTHLVLVDPFCFHRFSLLSMPYLLPALKNRGKQMKNAASRIRNLRQRRFDPLYAVYASASYLS